MLLQLVALLAVPCWMLGKVKRLTASNVLHVLDVLPAPHGASPWSRVWTPTCAHPSAVSPLPGQPPGSDEPIEDVVSRMTAMLYFWAAAPAMSALEVAPTVMLGMPMIPAKIVGITTFWATVIAFAVFTAPTHEMPAA